MRAKLVDLQDAYLLLDPRQRLLWIASDVVTAFEEVQASETDRHAAWFAAAVDAVQARLDDTPASNLSENTIVFFLEAVVFIALLLSPTCGDRDA